LKHEVRRKSGGVAFYGLIERLRCYAVQTGKVAIENDFFGSNEKHQLRNVFRFQDND
jgi:hypothetical protein